MGEVFLSYLTVDIRPLEGEYSMNNAIIVNENDNIGLAIRDLKAGERVVLSSKNGERAVVLKDDVGFLHKLALTDIKAGEKVLKYGQVIGGATRDIAAGEHVHTHNIKSLRGQIKRPRLDG